MRPDGSAERDVAIVGAGVGGMVAAIDLARRGLQVCVHEARPEVGGKLAEVIREAGPIDIGPTVLTMRWVFEELLADVGLDLASTVPMQRAAILARHWWPDGARLDLFADLDRSVDAIGAFSGASDAAAYRAFAARCERLYDTLERPFLRSQRPNVAQLVARVGPMRLDRLRGIQPFSTLWAALVGTFRDPRLRQLFGRYATYCGSSPFEAPATLMLIAHVERQGVWLVEGGMIRLARALARIATDLGVEIRCDAPIARIRVSRGRAIGLEGIDGSMIDARAVVFNADARALALGRFGHEAARAVPGTAHARPSLSALTWAMSIDAAAAPLSRHNVFFNDDYPAEFDALIGKGRLPADPTLYACAQDRDASIAGAAPVAGRARAAERLFCLVNAPAIVQGGGSVTQEEIQRCEKLIFRRLERHGLRPAATPPTLVGSPMDFERRFPATGGALYGPISAGWKTTFARLASRSRVQGLYLAGGSVHPGPGVPMAALSGRLAAAALLEDLASTNRSRVAAMRGGTATG